MLRFLNSCDTKYLQHKWTMANRLEGKSPPNLKEVKVQFDWMQKYIASSLGKDSTETKYYPAKGKTCFRQYAYPFGMQSMKKFIRASFSDGILTDVDMVNAHPVILRGVCEYFGISCSALIVYIEKRDEILAEAVKSTGISRDLCKEAFLAATNDDQVRSRMNNSDFYIRYDAEMKKIQTELAKQPKLEWIWDERKQTEGDCDEEEEEAKEETFHVNENGSFLNLVLCHIEDMALKLACDLFKAKDIAVNSLHFDGVMLHGMFYGDTNLLRELEAHVNGGMAKRGLKLALRFAYKEHWPKREDGTPHKLITILPDFTTAEKYKIWNYPTFDECVKKMRFFETHGKVLGDGNKPAYVIEEDEVPMVIDGLSFRMRYDHYFVTTPNKNGHMKSHAKLLDVKESGIARFTENLSEYRGMDQYPNESDCPKNMFNLWRPFAVKTLLSTMDPEKLLSMNEGEKAELERAVEEIKDHLRILVSRDEALFNFVYDFIAHMLQYPHIKPGILLAFIGKKRCGKGSVIRLLEALIDGGKKHHIATVINPQYQIFKKFNALFAKSFIIHLDEVTPKDFDDCHKNLKNGISEPTLAMEQKGIDPFMVTSLHRWIITTNPDGTSTCPHSPFPPRVQQELEGREVTIQCSDELIGNDAHFQKLADLIKRPCVQVALYHDLMQRDGIPNGPFTASMLPTSSVAIAKKEVEIDPLLSFLKHFTRAQKPEDSGVDLSSDQLMLLFEDWVIDAKLDSERKFIQLIKATVEPAISLSGRIGCLCRKSSLPKHAIGDTRKVKNGPRVRRFDLNALRLWMGEKQDVVMADAESGK